VSNYPSERYLSVAVKAVRQAGRILMSHLGRLKAPDVMRKGPSDWVTTVDHASEEAIVKALTKAFPDHTVKAEESAPTTASSSYQWLIDPLDGTVNYIHRFPMFGISVALLRFGVLEVGVVYDPLREEMFTARRGHGAWLNGRRIRVSGQPLLKESLLATGFPFRAKRYLDPYLASFRRIFLETGSIRRAGSAALDLAYTACGRLDGFWEMALSPWDMAAGALLIQEAGGRVSDFFGRDTYLEAGHITAGNRSIHPRLVRILTPIFQPVFSSRR
jgi:myo-inositol-1(or 4)-monophosphatase